MARTAFFAAVVLLGFLAFPANAQSVSDPVSWTFESTKVSDVEYELTATASLQAGWYVYSQNLDDGGPIPTTFSFDIADTGIEQPTMEEIGSVKEGYDEMFGMNVAKYAKQVVFKTTVKLEKPAVLKGDVRFMACDAERCLPPKSVPFAFELQ